MDEKIILTINKLNKQYNNIRLDIRDIYSNDKLLTVEILIDINNIGFKLLKIEDITNNDYELEWIDYQIRNTIKEMITSFYRIEL